MNKLTVGKYAEKKIKQGQSVLEAQDYPDLGLTNQLVALFNTQQVFLGTAYLAPQNKGVGWFLSPQAVVLDQAYFQQLFQQAQMARARYETDSQTTAYRLFNQEGDGFGGLTIDRYQDYAVFSWYNTFVYDLKAVIVAAFQQVFPELIGAYEKVRFKGLEHESAHLYGELAPETFTVLENGVAYQVFMNEGLMTGIFLDQHEVRGSLVAGLAAGKRLLNLFSYTAAFSVAAAVGGASETTSVDLAKRSRELSEAHFRANSLALDKHQFYVMDVFAYFKYAQRHHLTYDVIVIDPPSFARNKKQTFSVAKDYHRLVRQALDLLEPGGVLVLSTNASNLSLEKFKKEIQKGLGQRNYQLLAMHRLPSDFKYNKKDERSNYLKVVTIKVTS